MREEELRRVRGKRKSKRGREGEGTIGELSKRLCPLHTVTDNIQLLPFHHQTISFPVPWGRASSQELVRPWLRRNYSDEATSKGQVLLDQLFNYSVFTVQLYVFTKTSPSQELKELLHDLRIFKSVP